MNGNLSKSSIMTREFDWLLLFVTIGLSIFGLVAVYTATRSLGSNSNIIMQTAAMGIGSILLFALCFFDYEQFQPLVKYIYIFCILLLGVVLLIGKSGTWGARSWIRIGSIGIQPTEIAKVGFVLSFSYHLSKVSEQINRPLILLGLLLHLAVPVALILLQPDMGSAMVFFFMFALMIFSAKLSYKYIIPILLALAASAPLIYKFVLSEFQQNRIKVFLNPDLDPLGKGYNVIQSKIAIGSGGLFGKGFLQGTQNQMGYLPTKYTDFIFSVIAEEFGFIGAILVVAALFFLIFRCFRIAQQADNLFGRYICVGVGAMLLFHTVENIGMCMGLLPVTGIPLPFISYGGTSMAVNLIAIGLVMSVCYHNKPRSIFEVY